MHPRQNARRLRIDPADHRVRMRAAHEGCVPHAGNADVIDEASLAEKQRAILDTWNARSDQSTHLIDRVRVSQRGPLQ